MNDHDVVSVTDLSHGGCSISCACGRSFVRTSKDKATADHLTHYGIEQARAALNGKATK